MLEPRGAASRFVGTVETVFQRVASRRPTPLSGRSASVPPDRDIHAFAGNRILPIAKDYDRDMIGGRIYLSKLT